MEQIGKWHTRVFASPAAKRSHLDFLAGKTGSVAAGGGDGEIKHSELVMCV